MPIAGFQLACGLLIVALAILGNAVAIRGIQAGVNTHTGERPFRQEFSTFKNSGAAFDLYILSLQRFQQRDQSSLLSYFEVAGKVIGALNRHEWRANYPSRHSWRSFQILGWSQWPKLCGILYPCQYAVPYMASTLRGTVRGMLPVIHVHLMATDSKKESIWYNAQQIAITYPREKRTQYRAAAQSLRIPYWDWSITPTMPPEVSQPMIYINTPNGTRNIQNPLYNYTFRPLPSSTDFPPIGSPVRAFENSSAGSATSCSLAHR